MNLSAVVVAGVCDHAARQRLLRSERFRYMSCVRLNSSLRQLFLLQERVPGSAASGSRRWISMVWGAFSAEGAEGMSSVSCWGEQMWRD